jgi:hypothetical protein
MPLLHEFSSKKLSSITANQEKDALKKLIRCKFVILYKYCNLEGKIDSPKINALYMDLCEHINEMEEDFLVKFLRIIANEVKLNPSINLFYPKLPLIENASHLNS